MELVQIDGMGAQLDDARALFTEYWNSFGFTPCFQGFELELRSLPGPYAPPRGALFLAPGRGCVALHPLDEETAELKRLYVRPGARGSGLGRKLASAAVAHARALRYARVVLDTLPAQMPAAVRLYRSLGFREVPPYLPEPAPGALCMELRLR